MLFRGDGLEHLGAIAVNGDGLEAQFPALHISGGDFIGGGFFGHIYCLADCAGDEGLNGGHHFNMGKIMNISFAVAGLEGTIEDGQMLQD